MAIQLLWCGETGASNRRLRTFLSCDGRGLYEQVIEKIIAPEAKMMCRLSSSLRRRVHVDFALLSRSLRLYSANTHVKTV